MFFDGKSKLGSSYQFSLLFRNVKPTPETDKTTKENGKKDETMQDSDISDNLMKEFDAKEGMPFDFNNVEDNINKLLQMFENDGKYLWFKILIIDH